ncbi:MAG: NADH-quinone oxidoreductase subunit NuoG, partial [Actinomycetes bacterium]
MSDRSRQPAQQDVPVPTRAEAGQPVSFRPYQPPFVTQSAVGTSPPSHAKSPETVTISIDGHERVVPKGQLIITAADEAGVYIPRFCYHPRMKPVGMCRMCLVEVSGPRGFNLMPACYNPVADGMEIRTTSAPTKKAQDGVLEFLLVNHPLDCPVCDKGGECPLQDQTLAYGPGETRFVEEKRHWDKPIPLSDLVYLDRERCIQCGRCVRFADEVAGDPLIDFAERSDLTEVITFPDEPYSSYFSGNVVQICPVGALTATPYRFKARPWDLEQVESSCTSCAVGCRVAVQSSSDELTRYIGVDSDPVNWGWLCDKGRFDYEAVNSPQRLRVPLVRQGDDLVEVSWSEALATAAEGLGAAADPASGRQAGVSGGEQVAVIGGARLPNEDAYAWSKLARVALGTDNVDAQLGDGLPAELVAGLPRATIDQAASAALVVLLAPDIKEELPVLYLRLRDAAANRRTPMVELSPRATGFTRYTSASLRYRPGQAADLVDALLAPEQPDGEVAGVPAAEVAAVRRRLADVGDGEAGERSAGEPSVVVVLGRPSMAESDADVAAAARRLASVPGVGFLSALRRSNVHGALDMGLAPGLLPGRVGLDVGRAWYEEQWGTSLPGKPGLDTSGILAAAARGHIGGLVLVGADPLADFPDAAAAVKGLSRARFVVAVDTFLTGSARMADVILPASTYAERRGTFTNLEGRDSWLGQMVTAPGMAWPDWMIASELAARLGCDFGWGSLDDVWAEVERISPLHRGVTYELINSSEGRDGVVVPIGPDRSIPMPRRLDPMADPGIGSTEAHLYPPTPLAVAGAGVGRVSLT